MLPTFRNIPQSKYLRRIESTPTASAAETRQFLTSYSVTDDALMLELWDTASGLAGLLNARGANTAPVKRSGQRDFVYDIAKRAYYHQPSNRKVSERTLRNAIAKTAREAQNRIREETKQMLAGAILFALWYARTRIILKALFRAVWIVSLGGLLFDSDAERAAFYLWVILFFEQLDQLKIAIETGTIPFNGHILSAAGRLARRANNAWQNIKLQKGKTLGHNKAKRILGENENHCRDSGDTPGCIELAELGWVDIDKMVRIGDSTCDGNCMCRIQTAYIATESN